MELIIISLHDVMHSVHVDYLERVLPMRCVYITVYADCHI